MIVLHYTGMASAAEARARLCDPAVEVSAHYVIDEDGTVWGLVPERQRAWHAGAASWAGEPDVNSRSIGIEIAHPGPDADGGGLKPFPEAQMTAVLAVVDAVASARDIPPERVVAHSDVAPGRKIDPGESFEWPRLVAAGRAVGPPEPVADGTAGVEQAPADAIRTFFEHSRVFGYGDWPDVAVLDAFRRRFHWWTGQLPGIPREQAPDVVPTLAESRVMAALARQWPAARTARAGRLTAENDGAAPGS